MDPELVNIPEADTTCSLCYAEFLYPDDLSMHISQVHSETVRDTLVTCQFCSIQLSDLEKYALHIRDEHISTLNCCKYCNRIFHDHDQYRKHESKHYTYVPKSMFSCSQCGKLYSNVLELELHERREHSNAADGVLLDCLPLLSSFLNIKALKFMQSLHDDVVYMCIKCEITTSDVNQYVQHLKIKNCQSPACDICSSVYKSKINLIKHYQSHKECFHHSQPRYKQCPECCKMFDRKLWGRHTKNCRPIKCRVCNIVYSTMNELAKHQSENHPLTVVLETCKYCNKEFAGKLSLEKHMGRTHWDLHLYKYICVDCNAVFKHPKKLFAHFSSMHKDLEPYTCKICDKKFKFRKRFTIHIKLDHNSVGYIELDENCHVFFSDKKSQKSFQSGSGSAHIKTEVSNVRKQVKFNINEEQNNQSYDKQPDQDITREQNDRSELNEDHEQLMLNTDFLSATETEGNQTEFEVETSQEKRKIRKRKQKSENEFIKLDSSDDEPLLELQKRARKMRRVKLNNATWNRKKQSNLRNNKKRFICNICKKYCYTFQNYHNHYSTHYKNSTLKCVKCSKTFKSMNDMNKHCSEEHSTSGLTQTLKNLLARRKNGTDSEVNMSEKFQRTIKSVDLRSDSVKVTITPVNQNQSVKNFIESFTPEDAPKTAKHININNSITVTPFVGKCREPLIKMTKCNLTSIESFDRRLRMPVHFRQVVGETHKVTIKQVAVEPNSYAQDNTENDNYESENDKSEPIPDVAAEVMLDETEETPPPKTLYIPHKIVLPKLPKEFSKVHIAHLQAEAPYYKIVKVEDVLNPQATKAKEKKPELMPKKDIQLPDGTKLVTANPLAHLLGDTPVEKILANARSKYYQTKPKDFEMAIAKAMLKLENPNAFPKKRRKKNEAGT